MDTKGYEDNQELRGLRIPVLERSSAVTQANFPFLSLRVQTIRQSGSRAGVSVHPDLRIRSRGQGTRVQMRKLCLRTLSTRLSLRAELWKRVTFRLKH